MNEHPSSNAVYIDTGQEHVKAPIALCALARAIDEIGDSWTLLILREVLCGATRFDIMQKELGISRAVLTDRLALLVERGILARQPIHEPGRRRQHAYLLTHKGRSLIPMLVALRTWSEHFIPGPTSPLRLHTKTGASIEAALTTADGQHVSTDDVVASLTTE